jgi:hypothetical protein
MNPALLTLIRLQSRAFIRRVARSTESRTRAAFLAIGLIVIVIWLGSGLMLAVAGRSAPTKGVPIPQRFAAVAPLALLGICVLTIVSSAGDKAIAFTPGEVDMLFPAPFTRRELLAYKLSKSTLAALLTALLMSLVLLRYADWWPACYVGVFFTLLFIQLFSTAGVLLGHAVGQRAHSLFQKIVLFGALIVALFVGRHWLSTHGGTEAFYHFKSSPVGRVILAPFDPFGRAITAPDLQTLLHFGALAMFIDVALLLVVVLLDAHYVEAALTASRRRYALIRRIRGGSMLGSGVKGDVTWSLPTLPWLMGAGPIIWRQASSAARSARGLLIVLLIVAVGVGPLFASAVKSTNIAQVLIGTMAWLTVLLSGLLKFDFRGDLDYIEELKALPLKPASLALGQIVVPTLILTAAHVLLLAGVLFATPGNRGVLIAAAFLALPFNALLMAMENLIFLLFPTRAAAASPGDFQVLGRQVAQLVMKAMAVMIGFLIAMGFAVPIYIMLGGPVVVLTAVAALVLLIETAALIPAIAWAYNRFDPSIDVPA